MTSVVLDSTRRPAKGIHRVSFAEYCAWEYLNWHTLEPFRETPLHGRQAILTPDDATESKILGGAFHTAVLEPQLFTKTYGIMPAFEGHPNSNIYKSAKADWTEKNKAFVPLKQEQYDSLIGMQAAARAHPKAAALLYGKVGKNELSMAWSDESTGVMCKGRVDRLARVKIGQLYPESPNKEDNAICMVDVKTTRFADPRLFEKDASKLGYHAQLASYRDGLALLQPGPVSVFIVAIENKPPFDVVVYQLGDDELEQGRLLYRRLFNIYAECEQKQKWPGHSNRIIPLTLSKWVLEQQDEV